jgi:uncharacterized protein HemX
MQHEEHTRTDEAQPSAPQSDPLQSVPSESPAPEHHGMAAIVGIILLVLIIALGGLYFWTMSSQETAPAAVVPEQPETDPVVEALMITEGSDELSALERDLNRTDLDAIDADLGQFEMELEAELQAGM